MYRCIGGLLSGVVLLAVLVGGCGEGSEASSSLTKAEFVEQADAVCVQRKKNWRSAVASYEKEVKVQGAESKPAVQREMAEGLLRGSLLPALHNQLEELEDLGAPKGGEKQVEKMLQALSKGIREVEDIGVEALFQAKFSEFKKQARALGVPCPL